MKTGRRIDTEVFVLRNIKGGGYVIDAANGHSTSPYHSDAQTFLSPGLAARAFYDWEDYVDQYEVVKVFRRDIVELEGKPVMECMSTTRRNEVIQKQKQQAVNPLYAFFKGLVHMWKEDDNCFRLKAIYTTCVVIGLFVWPVLFGYMDPKAPLLLLIISAPLISVVFPAATGIIIMGVFFSIRGIRNAITSTVNTGRKN